MASPVVVLRRAVAAPAPAAHGAVDDDACCKNIIHNIQNAVVCLMIIIMSHVACYGHLSELLFVFAKKNKPNVLQSSEML